MTIQTAKADTMRQDFFKKRNSNATQLDAMPFTPPSGSTRQQTGGGSRMSKSRGFQGSIGTTGLTTIRGATPQNGRGFGGIP